MSLVKVLIVDDEEDMRHLIEMYLRNSSIDTMNAENGQIALEMIQLEKPDLVLLDVMLPEMNGFELCQEIRSRYNIPIIFLSARGEEWDKVEGLQLGADDYIVKPFSPGELVARIHTVLRRVKETEKGKKVSEIKFGKISIDRLKRKAVIDGQNIPLTPKEFDLLIYLIENANHTVSRQALLQNIWNDDFLGNERTVDTHIKTLRIKLKEADYIRTVWGKGYKIEVTND